MNRPWLTRLWKTLTGPSKRKHRQSLRLRPTLEVLEARTLPSGVFPFVQSINRMTPAGPITNASSVSYAVTFSEPVTGVDPTDFQLADTGTVGTTLTQVTPVSASVYTVTVSGITGNGTLGLNLVDNNSIRDLAGNPLTQQNAPAAFQAPQSYATGPFPVAVVLGDTTGDGKLDLVVANYDSPTVSVLLGNGNSTFQAQQTFATVSGTPVSVVLADVNGDGNLDIVAATGHGNAVNVLLGNGNGTFQAPEILPVGNDVTSAVVSDVNGDGQPDIIATNDFSSTVSVLLGNGDGTFQAQQTFAAGGNAHFVVVSDINGDGQPDLVIANTFSNTASLLLGNGNGTFQASQTFATGNNPRAVAVSDLNGDSKPDLIFANAISNTVSVFLGNGNGSFQAQQTYASGEPFSVAVADVNGDGKLDLVVANRGSNNVSVLMGNGNGTFQTLTTFAAAGLSASVAAGDVNGDGRLDIATANIINNTVSVLLNATNGDFTGQTYTIDTVAPFVASINRADASPDQCRHGAFHGHLQRTRHRRRSHRLPAADTGTVGTTLTQVTPVSTSVYR